MWFNNIYISWYKRELFIVVLIIFLIICLLIKNKKYILYEFVVIKLILLRIYRLIKE